MPAAGPPTQAPAPGLGLAPRPPTVRARGNDATIARHNALVSPTALVSWAHGSDVGAAAQDGTSRAAADAAWRAMVLDFTNGLRVHGGVETDTDIAHAHEPTDWARWGPQQAEERDFVIAVVNRAWARRFDGKKEPTRGSGAVAEANVLLGIFERDRSEFDRKVIPVVLPGATKDALPLRLRGTTSWFVVDGCDEAGLAALIRRIHGLPEAVLLPVPKPTPPLPAAATPPPAAAAARQGPEDDGARPSRAARPTRANPLAGASDDDLAARLAVVESSLRTLPTDAANESVALPWARAWHGLQSERAAIAAETARRAVLRPDRTAGERLAATVPALRHGSTAWVAVAVAVVPDLAVAADTAPTVEEQRRWLEAWRLETEPVPVLDLSAPAHRASGTAVFPGDPAGAAPADGTSGRWRIELDDVGSTTVAAALPDALASTGGQLAWPGQPGEVVLGADLSMPVRRDAVELWLLTALELAGARLRNLPDGTRVDVQAEIVMPTSVLPPGHRQPATITVHLVDSGRDADAPQQPPTRTPAGKALPLSRLSPARRTCTARDLRAPAAAVKATRALVRALLEQFGVEDTAVLRSDGTLEPRRAAEEDQQLVHQHAVTLGLPVDEASPMDRRAQAAALRQQARDLVAPPPG